jgi:copper homeostasis protein
MNSLEIIVETLEDAQAAETGGATQLDLKAHYPCSGITPSIGMVTVISQSVKIPIIMMIRPHARSFQASAGDLQAAAEDIQAAKKVGVRDFMFGFLTEEKTLDIKAAEQLRTTAGDARIHMHLGWELCNDPWQALHQLLDLGFHSIHTGGLSTQGKAFGGSALDAIANIQRIAKIIDGRMQIFLAGSVSADNAAELIRATGITNLHCGRGVRTPPSAEGGVDINKVRLLRQAQLSAIENPR